MGKGTGAGGKLANASEDTKAQALGNRNVSVLKKPANLQKLQYRGKIPMDEVKKHRTPQDAWMVIKGKVCPVLPFIDALHHETSIPVDAREWGFESVISESARSPCFSMTTHCDPFKSFTRADGGADHRCMTSVHGPITPVAT
eukprot:843967-Rhodomonas_salina.2